MFPLNTGSVMDSDLCLHSLTSRKTSDNCKKIQITVKVWWQVSLEGQAAGKIVMQFSKTFSNGIKTEEERLKGHAQWPIFVNRSNRCSSKVAGLGLEKTSQPIWKTQFIIFTGLFFTQKIWRILTAFFPKIAELLKMFKKFKRQERDNNYISFQKVNCTRSWALLFETLRKTIFLFCTKVIKSRPKRLIVAERFLTFILSVAEFNEML